MIITGVIHVIHGIWSLGSCTLLTIHKELINSEVTSSKKLTISLPPNTHFTPTRPHKINLGITALIPWISSITFICFFYRLKYSINCICPYIQSLDTLWTPWDLYFFNSYHNTIYCRFPIKLLPLSYLNIEMVLKCYLNWDNYQLHISYKFMSRYTSLIV